MKLSKRSWGTWQNREVSLYEIEANGLRICASDCGALLQCLQVKNGRCETVDAVLGYDTLDQYLASETFFGAVVGPIADRLAEGRCTLGGKTVQFPLNAGPDCMHSAGKGFHTFLWKAEPLSDGVAFLRDFQDGEAGLPGHLQVRLSYHIPARNTLRIEYRAECDRETALSFTNHSYFTLNGGKAHCRDHVLTLHASTYAETMRNSDPICTGRALPVQDTPYDLRSGAKIGDVLACSDFAEIRTGGGIDHFFPIDGEGMRLHAELASQADGLKLGCYSDAPGVLVYTANGLEDELGKGGNLYGRNWAVCLETECFPNAVNRSHLRHQVLLAPGEVYSSATEFVFTVL